MADEIKGELKEYAEESFDRKTQEDFFKAIKTCLEDGLDWEWVRTATYHKKPAQGCLYGFGLGFNDGFRVEMKRKLARETNKEPEEFLNELLDWDSLPSSPKSKTEEKEVAEKAIEKEPIVALGSHCQTSHIAGSCESKSPTASRNFTF